jgi:hypothetical protein
MRVTLPLLWFLLLSGAGTGRAADCPGPGQPVALKTVIRGVIGNLDKKSERVVRSEADWKALWGQLGLPLKPSPAAPAIDFSTNVVLGVTAGAGRGVVEVEIVRVEQRAACLHVTVAERAVPKNMAADQFSKFHPFHFVRIPPAKDPVVFTYVKAAPPKKTAE